MTRQMLLNTTVDKMSYFAIFYVFIFSSEEVYIKLPQNYGVFSCFFLYKCETIVFQVVLVNYDGK